MNATATKEAKKEGTTEDGEKLELEKEASKIKDRERTAQRKHEAAKDVLVKTNPRNVTVEQRKATEQKPAKDQKQPGKKELQNAMVGASTMNATATKEAKKEGTTEDGEKLELEKEASKAKE